MRGVFVFHVVPRKQVAGEHRRARRCEQSVRTGETPMLPNRGFAASAA